MGCWEEGEVISFSMIMYQRKGLRIIIISSRDKTVFGEGGGRWKANLVGWLFIYLFVWESVQGENKEFSGGKERKGKEGKEGKYDILEMIHVGNEKT